VAQIDFDTAVGLGNEDDIVDALDAICRSGEPGAQRGRIIALAMETSSPAVRNAAAIALAELGVDGTRELLIDLIKRNETQGANGTLLYVLREINAFVPLSVLIDIMTEDQTHEALEGALDIIANNAARYEARQKAEAISRMGPLLHATAPHTAHAAKLAISYLTRKSAYRRRRR
jgi:hypothetical protein